MSKKKNRQFNQNNQSSGYSAPVAGSSELVGEYRIIRHDLIRVAIMNLIFLAAVLTLYYTNLHSGYLERWFGRVLHF